jgi:hypothetical protein
MKELSRLSSGSLLHSLHSEIQVPAPYSEDIFLLATAAAGTTHVAGIEELEPFLRPGDRLELVRVPDNPSDPNAIKIYTRDRVKVGYVPRKDNQILARLMDAGKLLYAVIREKRWDRDWLQLGIDIYMTED